MSAGLLSIAYFPPIAWFQHAMKYDTLILECHENYLKQTYRNRCKILTANGILDLSIPIIHQPGKQLISEILTQENEPWRRHHWQAICAAYGKSAFFTYYRDNLEKFFFKSEPVKLFEYNLALLKLLFKMLKIEKEITFNTRFEPIPDDMQDFRCKFNAKNTPSNLELLEEKTYFQVFADKYPFQANLSILDLLFNEGPISKDYLI